MKRGFTLVEVLLVTGLMGVVSGYVFMLHFETYAATARIEAQVVLQREASLAAEVIASDIRSGSMTTTRFVVRDKRLWRGDRAIAKHCESIASERNGDAWTVTLKFGRFAGINRRLSISRVIAVEAR